MTHELQENIDELINVIKEWAKDDYESGHPMDIYDVNEFKLILQEEPIFLKLCNTLFSYYYNAFEDCHNNE